MVVPEDLEELEVITILSEAVCKEDLFQQATTSAQECLFEALGGKKESEELITKVLGPSIFAKYAANLDEITAIAAITSSAPAELLTVIQGDWRLLIRLKGLSEAKVGTDVQVTEFHQNTSGAMGFDFVILTAPMRQSGIDIEPPNILSPTHASASGSNGEGEAQRHITYFTSSNRFGPQAFDRPPETVIPDDILTKTPEGNRSTPRFYSITVSYRVVPSDSGDVINELEYLYPVVSKTPICDQEVACLVGERIDTETS
ncbi:MAG: hypothetical protein M1831_003558 [Alyxoria varia]|nr:MAG: hypothetical protein M1831_003558 [Alyxoria varia]